MDIIKQIEEQITNNADHTYIEDLSVIRKILDDAWEIYDYEHKINNVPSGSELFHMGKFIDFAIEDFQFDLLNLEDQLIDWPEDSRDLEEEMRQQDEFYSNR